ncbi:MAG: calcium-binding EGF-like domain-containing protein [Sandaracinaceae bacterium]|nr:calcium-binding EGF-like domain-containing protein [Sandaracinaceae bacterium]
MRACDPHGRCELEAGAALCRCDAGWTGARCDEHAREAYDRVLVSIDLADPAALVLDDGRVLFSGTRGGRTLPLIERFRVYYTSDGAFRHFAHSEYDGHSDDVFIELPGGSRATIPVRWNELQTGAEYSLDVRRTDGTWVAPCQGAAILRGALGHDYAGRCRSAAADVPLEEVSALRVCAAEGGRWDRARCGETKWTATGESADVPIP